MFQQPKEASETPFYHPLINTSKNRGLGIRNFRESHEESEPAATKTPGKFLLTLFSPIYGAINFQPKSETASVREAPLALNLTLELPKK